VEGGAGKEGEAVHEPNSPSAETPNGTPSRALEGSPSAPGAKRKVPLRACSFACSMLLIAALACEQASASIAAAGRHSQHLTCEHVVSPAAVLCSSNRPCRARRKQHHPAR
jgi:hypothetical protein